MQNETYDYVIVGGGAAGCVVAHRLVTETNAKVLLIEAGINDEIEAVENTSINSMISLWGSPHDWKFETEPQTGLNRRKINIAQGKILGGGTSINAMMYIRGNKRDFDSWAESGCPDWAYEKLLPFFKKTEKYESGGNYYHGDEGLLNVIDYKNPSPVSHSFKDAAKELGYQADDFDCNAEQHENGAFFYQSTRTPENLRCNTSRAFIRPIESNPNFTIKYSTVATKVILDGSKVIGIEVLENGELKQINVNHEVILSAGAFSSPKILMLSGIGPEETLNQFGIIVNQKLEGVGQNLQDHLLFGVAFKSTEIFDTPNLLSEAGLFTYTKEITQNQSPDLQFFFGPIQFVEPQYRIDAPAFTFAPILAQPKSRGYVTLKSTDPMDNAIVNPNYLSEQEDVDVLVAGIELARKFSQTNAMSKFYDMEIAPGKDAVTKAQLEEYIRNVASTVWHPVGTCKMGIDDMSVVNQDLSVIGVEGLRVADASIMPTITSGNTNAAAIMIGEKAADYILNTKSGI
jgi:choline dehydrogenase